MFSVFKVLYSISTNNEVTHQVKGFSYKSFKIRILRVFYFNYNTRLMANCFLGSQNLIQDDGFRKALYIIDIGQNDIADSFDKNLTYVQVIKRFPSIITEIRNAIKALYKQGGRKFWVHNTGPLGCLPQKLSMVEKKDLDQFGCVSSYNEAAKLFNGGLFHLCQELRLELKDVNIVYVDIYSIKYDLIANSSKYGPPYNYNIKVTCGQPGHQVCDEGSRFVSWDGIHYTEAANAFFASKVLSKAYSTPRVTFDFFC
ncbi:hypothetical protein UlMin_015143 [Ulmus minor]